MLKLVDVSFDHLMFFNTFVTSLTFPRLFKWMISWRLWEISETTDTALSGFQLKNSWLLEGNFACYRPLPGESKDLEILRHSWLTISDLFKVSEAADICTLWRDTWKFVRMEGDYTRCCIDGMTRFSFKYWSWVIDRFWVSHLLGFIRYLDFLQVITSCKS